MRENEQLNRQTGRPVQTKPHHRMLWYNPLFFSLVIIITLIIDVIW